MEVGKYIEMKEKNRTRKAWKVGEEEEYDEGEVNEMEGKVGDKIFTKYALNQYILNGLYTWRNHIPLMLFISLRLIENPNDMEPADDEVEVIR